MKKKQFINKNDKSKYKKSCPCQSIKLKKMLTIFAFEAQSLYNRNISSLPDSRLHPNLAASLLFTTVFPSTNGLLPKTIESL